MVKSDELLLLHAILEKNDGKSIAYYMQWTEAVEFDKVEGGSFRLLPLLYKRLALIDETVPHLNTLKGIYRHCLYRNSLLFHKVFNALTELEKMGVSVIVLKGAALIAAYYKDIGARPMDDVDLLVREQDVEKTLQFLIESGWQKKFSSSVSKPVKHTHAIGLLNHEGQGLDIHWRAFYECPWEEADLLLWKQLEIIMFKGLTIRILNPTFQILNNCSHGIRWNPISSIRWIVDVLLIMEKRADAIDWELLVSESVARKFTLTMLYTLGFLKSQFNAHIPEDVLNSLAARPKDPQEYHLLKILTSPPSFGNMHHKWLIHCYSMGTATFWEKAASFPDFLKEYWSLQSTHQLPLYIMKKTYCKLIERHKNIPKSYGKL